MITETEQKQLDKYQVWMVQKSSRGEYIINIFNGTYWFSATSKDFKTAFLGVIEKIKEQESF